MPKVVDIEASKMRIVRATWAVIAADGIESASMRRVAQQAGCTTGLITHYFRDKDDLVTYAYRVVLDRMIADAARSLEQPGSVAERLLAAIEAIEPVDAGMRLYTVVLLNFWSHAASNAVYARHCRADYRRWRRLIDGVIRAGITSGELRRDTDVRALTDLITLISDGLSVGMMLTPRAYPLARRRALIRSIIEPLLAR